MVEKSQNQELRLFGLRLRDIRLQFGMTLEQTQAVLKDLGAYTAVNLDGGPSTTMAVRQGEKLKVVTNTTGVKDRQTPVGSALILVRTE